MLLAGASRVVITPPLETSSGGFGEWNTRYFTGIAAETYARALVLQNDPGVPIAIVSVEATEACEPVVRKIRSEVERRAEIPARNVLVTMTHTHAANGLMRPTPPYVTVTEQKIADAVVLARQRLCPALVGWSSREIPGPATNRRILLKNGRVWPRFFVGPKIPGRENAEHVFSKMNYGPNVDYRKVPPAGDIIGPGPVNKELSVMRVVNQENGNLIACVAHYACHASAALETLNVHGDFPGFACSRIEELMGGTCLFLAGASANINCNAFLRNRTDEEARRLGSEFSEQILVVLATSSEKTDPKLALDSVQSWLPLRDEMKTQINREQRESLAANQEAETDLREVERISHEIRILENLEQIGAIPPVTREGKIPIEISAVRIGSRVLVTVPGELFVETAMRIGQLSSLYSILVVSHCNGWTGYIPEARAFGQGGYEDSPCYCSFVGPQSEENILRACRTLLSSKRGEGSRVADMPTAG